MKKRFLSVALAVVMVHLVGCGTTYQEATGQVESNTSRAFGNGYFTIITEWGSGYKIVYANDTKVKYLIMSKSQYMSGITPLYNADGTLQIYEESED